ncbi:MAG TPA: calcium-binding protein [bacterium]|nr:calcium-binding protein [bacterium]
MCQVSSTSVPVRSWSGLGVETHSGRSSTLTSDPFGNHRITASSADDLIRAREESFAGLRWLVVDVNDDRYRIPLSGPRAARSVAIDAGFGNDAVVVDPSVNFPLFIRGGAGDDYLKAGNGPAALVGGEGRDTLVGGPSDDLLLGGGGNDVIHTGGGRDMVSVSGLYRRLRDGWCERPSLPTACDQPAPLPPSVEASLPPVATLPAPKPMPAPVVPTPVTPPPPRSQPQPQRPVPPPAPKPYTPAKPRLNDLLSAVDTYDEKGFKSGQSMAKNLLTALYQSPSAFRQALSSISSQDERDDASASFLRALFDAGPGGIALFKGLPAADKKALGDYLGAGNCWNAQKKGLMLTMSKVTGIWDHNFGTDQQAQDYLRRYAGVL